MTPGRSLIDARTPGFSLLEVLIAIVVLSIGLLGLAGLQFSALRGNSQSYERSQAHLLAYEIADAMRANRLATSQGAFEIAPDDTPALPAVDCAVASCTSAESAAFALANWHARMRILLPGSTARITCSTAPCTPTAPCAQGVTHTVFVMWDENRTGLSSADSVATSCPAGAGFDPALHLACVQATFAP